MRMRVDGFRRWTLIRAADRDSSRRDRRVERHVHNSRAARLTCVSATLLRDSENPRFRHVHVDTPPLPLTTSLE